MARNQITFINNQGDGYADKLEVDDGMALEALVADRVRGDSSDFTIRVNGAPEARDYVLKSGDRVSVTPNKIAGAR